MTESGPAGSIPITFQSLMMIDRECDAKDGATRLNGGLVFVGRATL
ncbi:hypothetical protein DYI24_06545 [Rhodopseudomonas sp. BR0C11]|nr:hypothetical protein [Rhodopseudomonas sp. BR0C11]NEV76700.1 hypothetical protein [Rhodopseudomonas sp. BR0C11]